MRAINLFKTHRNLYIALMVLAVMSVALGINFWLTTPTFQQLDIPKNFIGSMFLLLGVAQVIFLNIYQNLKLVRVTTAISAGFMLFWGAALTQTFFSGKTSLQLPIIYVALAILQLALLVEPSINPVSHPPNESK